MSKYRTPSEEWYRFINLESQSSSDMSAGPELTDSRWLSVAGWTPETFAAAKEAQGNRCAICNEVPVKQSEATEALVPDHKHGNPPEPRALLCPGCNSALGLLKDSPERCEAAAAYLKRWS